MMLPGFLPNVGDMLGQHNGSGGFTPGLGFAFGMTGNDYIDKALRNGWLSKDSIVSPATTNALEDIQVRIALEPIRDLKIDLTANRTRNKSNEIQFMFDGMPTLQSGNFNMSIITIRSAFGRHNANNGYASKPFTNFLNNLEIIQQRVQNLYAGATVPTTKDAVTGVGVVDMYSPDVMIPAFLAAYTNRNAKNSSLDLFPGLFSMMPNWRLTYSGLRKLPFFQMQF